MKKRIKSRLTEIFFSITCIVVFSFSLFLFYKDLNSSSVRKDKDVVATVHYKYKIAQRKFNDRVVWERLQQDSPLYDADTLRTSDGSIATLTFINGAVIDVRENTMIQIYYSKDQGLSLNIGGGNIVVDSTKSEESIDIKLDDGSIFNISSGSKAEALTDSSTGTKNITLEEGKADLTSADGSVTNLLEGSALKIDDDGVKVNQLTILSPTNNMQAYSFNNKAVPIEFKWLKAPSSSDIPVVLEISDNKDFNKIQTHIIEEGNSYTEYTQSMRVYWRIKLENDEEYATNGKVSVQNIENIYPLSPIQASVFTYINELPHIGLTWRGNEHAKFYKVEVSDTQDFKEVLIDTNVDSERFTISSLEGGTYYWRVTPYYSYSNIGFLNPSMTCAFKIMKENNVVPVTLALPVDNSNLSLKRSGQDVMFMWKYGSNNSSYEIQFSKDEAFDSISKSYASNLRNCKVNMSLQDFIEAKYYWRVKATDSNGEVSYSNTFGFNVSKYIPGTNKLVFPGDGYSVTSAYLRDLDFTWKLSDEYKNKNTHCVFQISKDKLFNSTVYEKRIENSALRNIDLPSGSYYWRVCVLDDDAESGMTYSNVFNLNVLSKMESCDFIYPKKNENLILYNNNTVNFKWNEVPGAEYYEFKLYRNQESLPFYELKDIKESSQSIALSDSRDDIHKNTYKVSVRPYSYENEGSSYNEGDAAEVPFTVHVALPISLEGPLDHTVVKGLDAVRNPTVFTWSTQEKLDKTKFILQKSERGIYRDYAVIDNPKKEVKINRLPQGSYQWTVSGYSSDGVNLDANVYNTLIVEEIPPLSRTRVIEPKDESIIDGKYLRLNRSISFKWDKVQGATDYTISLYQRRSNGTLKNIFSIPNYKLTEYNFKNLELLDIGDFEFQVTAFVHAKDGFVEQRSNISVSKLQISFALPNEVDVMEMEPMYGE